MESDKQFCESENSLPVRNGWSWKIYESVEEEIKCCFSGHRSLQNIYDMYKDTNTKNESSRPTIH